MQLKREREKNINSNFLSLFKNWNETIVSFILFIFFFFHGSESFNARLMLVVALTALKIARMTASHEERVFLLTVQSRRRVSAEIIRSDDPTVSRIIVFGFLSRALSARILVRWNVAPLGLGDVGSRLNQPRHLQLRATEQSSIAPSSPSTFSSLSFFFLLILLPFLSLLSFLFLSLSRLPSRLDSDPSQTRITRDTLLPTPFQRTAARFFSLSFSLSSLSLSPRQRFRLFSRGFLLSSIRALPSARQPPRFDTSIGLWGNVATWFVVVTAIVGDRAVPSCRHFCFLEYLWKKYSLEILKRGWRRVNVSSLFLSLLLSRVRDNEWSDELMIYREGISHILGDCSRMTWHRFELLCL